MGINQYPQEFSQWYDRIMQAGYHDHVQSAKSLNLLLPKKASVLELGIGTGLLAEKLIKKGHRVVGVDFSGTMLEIARERLGPDVKLYKQDVVNLEVPGPYDAAISNEGVWAIMDDGVEPFLISHIVTKKQNAQALKSLSSKLNYWSPLLIGIKELDDFDGLNLGEGVSYDEEVEVGARKVKVQYQVKKGDRVLASHHVQFRKFTLAEMIDLACENGFKKSESVGNANWGGLLKKG